MRGFDVFFSFDDGNEDDGILCEADLRSAGCVGTQCLHEALASIHEHAAGVTHHQYVVALEAEINVAGIADLAEHHGGRNA